MEGLDEYLGCKTSATEAVNELAFEAGRPEAYFGRLCSVMQAYLHCSRPIILARCGAPAWDLVTRVTRPSLPPPPHPLSLRDAAAGDAGLAGGDDAAVRAHALPRGILARRQERSLKPDAPVPSAPFPLAPS